MNGVVALGCGALFAVGACVSGVVRPSKVLGFFDLGGAWDATLLVVFASALAVHLLAWPAASRMKTPRFGGSFPGKAAPTVDHALVAGAALFGVGWGLSGFCPGPALVSIVSGTPASLVFVAAMVVGMWLFDAGNATRRRRSED